MYQIQLLYILFFARIAIPDMKVPEIPKHELSYKRENYYQHKADYHAVKE